jgi:3-oxoacyl-[acyl-carrier-protein] synthase II
MSPDVLWAALAAGISGVRRLSSLPESPLPSPFGAECRSFTGALEDFGPLDKNQQKAIRKGIKLMCRETQMGVAAAQRALAEAGLDVAVHDPERTGVVFGSDYMLTVPEDYAESVARCGGAAGRFDFDQWGGEGLDRMSPLWLLKYLPNMPASHIAIYNDLRGPNNTLTMREAAGNLAVAEAVQTIRHGRADCMLAGATGTRLHPMKSVHAVHQEQIVEAGLSEDPATLSRPFDLHRRGMVLGEGAAAVVLEELGSAAARGATIYGEVVGAGSGFAADRNLRGKCDAALASAMQNALRDARLASADIGHVHAHGLSTSLRDAEEARAIVAVLGKHSQEVPIVAAKSYFGNLGAGSGMIELIASLLALRHGRLFRTLNYSTPDSTCPIQVATGGDASPGKCFLNLSVTPQGQASALLISAV